MKFLDWVVEFGTLITNFFCLQAQYAGVVAGQWLELRLQMLGCAVVTAIAIISVIQHKSGSVSPGLVGLAISYALGVTGNLQQILSFVIV